MGFSCIGGEMERLVLLVLFFKGGRRGNKGVQREAFFCDCFALQQVWCTALFLALQLCKLTQRYYKYIHKSAIGVSKSKSHFGHGSVQIHIWSQILLRSIMGERKTWTNVEPFFSFEVFFPQELGSKWCETKALKQDGNKDFRSHTREQEASR